ncbi:MAG: hypothetical protein AUG44_04295 [Actinobacteria bacterium 13_1_20CM_3_71_11]|nr:MAG: hypothetical protein AUG44_04295 [Actinobacteria bacterium 13_1_20CM_3_71_11]
MAIPRARSVAEAHLYLGLVPCACGEVDFDAGTEVLSHTPPVVRYLGNCSRCGQFRGFILEIVNPPDDEDLPFAFGYGAEPSTLIDAGIWLVVAQQLAEGAHEASVAGDEAAPLAHELMVSTAAAVDEIVKFLPDDAEAVPDEAFWTEGGRAARRAAPDWFTRAYLVVLQAERWDAVKELEEGR